MSFQKAETIENPKNRENQTIHFTDLLARISELTQIAQEERRRRKNLEKKFFRYKIKRIRKEERQEKKEGGWYCEI